MSADQGVMYETARLQRIIELLCKYGAAKFGDEWWPGNARNWIGDEGRELEYLLDPGSATEADIWHPYHPHQDAPDWDVVADQIAYGIVLAAIAELGFTPTALRAAELAVMTTDALP